MIASAAADIASRRGASTTCSFATAHAELAHACGSKSDIILIDYAEIASSSGVSGKESAAKAQAVFDRF